MIRWQYRIVNIGVVFAADRLGMTLAYFGQRGWELQTIFDKSLVWMQGMEQGFMVFKRAVAPGEEPDGPWAEVWTPEQVAEQYQESQRQS